LRIGQLGQLTFSPTSVLEFSSSFSASGNLNFWRHSHILLFLRWLSRLSTSKVSFFLWYFNFIYLITRIRFYYLFILGHIELEFRASCLLGRGSATWIHPKLFFALFFR
jgi:hypothetical protein